MSPVRLSPIIIGQIRGCWVMGEITDCRIVDMIPVETAYPSYILYVVERISDGRKFKISRVKIGKVIQNE